MKLANGDRSVGRIAMLKLESEGEAMLEKINMTPSERAAREDLGKNGAIGADHSRY